MQNEISELKKFVEKNENVVLTDKNLDSVI